jgi:hypothetical protein
MISGEQAAPIGRPHICSYVLELCVINNGDFTVIFVHMIRVCMSCEGMYSINILSTKGTALSAGMFG